ncbi:hypothetical protein KC318_g5959 [Hortaea werneckii]|nr:hypothetical protein KC334_g6119 [Hortaea werneckii]KAI7010862.1 hypothetical protein KC355_g5990 [Hortaea werneckii]KAI7667309.1 hypothetical protein KC318_g5959 [Hortaea werneckii]
MASQTSSQGTLERLSSAQLLDGVTVVQLQRSQQLTGNPIKERFGNALYNFFIIYPEQVTNDFEQAYKAAQASAKFGEQRLKQSLGGCRDGSGSLQLPSLRQAFDSISWTIQQSPSLEGLAFGITETHVLHALEYTHGHGKRVDYDEFKTWMMKQPKQHREIFKWLTKRVQVFIQRCGGPSFWLEAGYKARQEVVYDMIHEFPGHITTNIFSTLAEAFSYAQTWGTDNVTDLVKEFRALIVY